MRLKSTPDKGLYVLLYSVFHVFPDLSILYYPIYSFLRHPITILCVHARLLHREPFLD